jgi:photosystem II stability/assembly factor-like uncharacterized protein
MQKRKTLFAITMGLSTLLIAFILGFTASDKPGDVSPATLSKGDVKGPSEVTWNTHLSNITAALVTQDFEGATYPPAGWTLDINGGTTQYWTRVTTASGYGVGTASTRYNFWTAAATTPRQSLITPALTISAGDSLKFDHAYAPYTSGTDSMQIERSTDGGTTWITLQQLWGNAAGGPLNTAPTSTSQFTPTASQWATKTYSIPTGTNKIRFVCKSGFGNDLFVDNIKIGAPLANDVATQSIDIPNPTGNGPQVPKATFKNNGTAVQTFNVTMMNASGYTSTQSVTSLAPNASAQVSFASWAPTPGTYAFTVFCSLASDQDRSNDTLRANISVINAIVGNWQNIAPFPLAAGGVTSYYWPDSNKVFTAGGSTTVAVTNCYFYDPVTNTYTPKASLPVTRGYGKLVRVRDSLYLVGSINSNFAAPDGAIYKYNPRTDTWTAKTPSTPIQEMGVMVWRDSLIICVGGSNNGFTGVQNTINVYNVFTDSWSTLTGTFPVAAMGLAGECIGNEIVLVGGVITGPAISNIAYRGTITPGSPISISWRAITNPYGEGVYRTSTGKWNNMVVFGPTQKSAAPPTGKMYGYNVPDSVITQFLPDGPARGNIPNLSFRITTDSVYAYTFGGYNGTASDATSSRYAFGRPVPPPPPTCTYGWTAQTSGITAAIYTVKTVSNTVGWFGAVGGVIKRTVNGGTNWNAVTPVTGDVYAIEALDSSTAWCTTSPTAAATFIYKTTNGGTSWTQVYTQANGFIDEIIMTSATTGYALGDPVGGVWTLLKTTDGGTTWTQMPSAPAQVGTEAGLNNSFQILGNNMWFGTSNTKVYHSTNLGLNWTSGTTTGTVNSNAVHFNNSTTGMTGGTVLLKSTDGGSTYSTITSLGTGTIYGIDGYSTYYWYIRGAAVYMSSNEGTSWTLAYTGTGTLYDINLYTPAGGCPTGWAASSTGGIYRMNIVTGINNNTTGIPTEYKLSQNYPNPFNPTTKISFALPKSGLVTLKIYDVLGKEVATLVNENRNAGSYIVDFNGASLSSGVYFYKLETSGFTDVKRMMLVK